MALLKEGGEDVRQRLEADPYLTLQSPITTFKCPPHLYCSLPTLCVPT